MERRENVFTNESVGHEGNPVKYSTNRGNAKRNSNCTPGSVQIPQSLLLFGDSNNLTRCVSDDYLSHGNFKRQRNTRKRAKPMSPLMPLHCEPAKRTTLVRKRQRGSLDQHDGTELFPLHNYRNCLHRSLPNEEHHARNCHAFCKSSSLSIDQQTAMVESPETNAVSSNSTSASSISPCQQHDFIHAIESKNSYSSICNRARNKTERFLIDAVREQFQPMLKDTRLCPKVDDIRPLRSNDIVPVYPHILGVGTFSRVTRVNLKESNGVNKNQKGRRYACKQLKQELLSNVGDFIKAAAELAYEAFILSCFDHPNIIKLRGLAEDGIASFGGAVNETQEMHMPLATSFFLIMDVLQETLDQRIERWNTISRPQSLVEIRQRSLEKISLCQQLASVLEHLHSKGVVYRDLKPQNIGFCEQEGGILKLFDFGLSRELPMSITDAASSPCGEGNANNPNEHVRFELSGMVGTIRYMAPEVCLSQPYNRDCDIYSWSIVAWEIWSEKKPFDTFTPDLYKTLVCKQGFRPTDEKNTNSIPNELEHLLKETWKPEPHQRMRWPGIRHRLDVFQKVEELRFQESILSEAIALRTGVAATMNNTVFHSPVQRLHGAINFDVHNQRLNRSGIDDIAFGEYTRKAFGSIQHPNVSRAQTSSLSPESRWSTECAPSVSAPILSFNNLDPRLYLLGGIGSTHETTGAA